MATYNQNIAYVEFYGEDKDQTVQKARWKAKFYGKGTPTVYATVEIVDGGDNNFTFDEGTTSYDFTISYMQTTTVDKYLKPASRINETTKDNIVLEVRYYKDSARTQLIGTDTFNIQANWYIQNSDFTWTSSAYTDEDVIVYEKWDNATANFSSGDIGAEILGDNGNVTFKFIASHVNLDSATISKTTGILRSNALLLYLKSMYNVESSTFSWFTPPSNKITAFLIHKSSGNSTASAYGGYGTSYEERIDIIQIENTPAKLVLPSRDDGYLPGMYLSGGVEYKDYSTATYVLENMYVFNPLP